MLGHRWTEWGTHLSHPVHGGLRIEIIRPMQPINRISVSTKGRAFSWEVRYIILAIIDLFILNLNPPFTEVDEYEVVETGWQDYFVAFMPPSSTSTWWLSLNYLTSWLQGRCTCEFDERAPYCVEVGTRPQPSLLQMLNSSILWDSILSMSTPNGVPLDSLWYLRPSAAFSIFNTFSNLSYSSLALKLQFLLCEYYLFGVCDL